MISPDELWRSLQYRPRWQQHVAQLMIVGLIALLICYYLLIPVWQQWRLIRDEVRQSAIHLPPTAWQFLQWQRSKNRQNFQQAEKEWQQIFLPEEGREDKESTYWLTSLAQTEGRLQRWQRLPVEKQGEWLQQPWQIEIIGQYQGLQQILAGLQQRKALFVLDQIEMEGIQGEVLLKMTLKHYYPREKSE